MYKFGGQPVVMDIMTTRYGSDFDERFGHKTGRTLLSATSGSLIGIGESKCNCCIMTIDACLMLSFNSPSMFCLVDYYFTNSLSPTIGCSKGESTNFS